MRFAQYRGVRLARDLHATLVPATSGSTAGVSWRGVSKPSGDVGGDLVDVVTEQSDFFGCIADVTRTRRGRRRAHGHVQDRRARQPAGRARPGRSGYTHQPHVVSAHTVEHVRDVCVRAHRRAGTQSSKLLAGHPSLLHVSTRTGQTTWVGDQQLAVGLLDDVESSSGAVSVNPGNLLVVITDGLTEVPERPRRRVRRRRPRPRRTRAPSGQHTWRKSRRRFSVRRRGTDGRRMIRRFWS